MRSPSCIALSTGQQQATGTSGSSVGTGLPTQFAPGSSDPQHLIGVPLVVPDAAYIAIHQFTSASTSPIAVSTAAYNGTKHPVQAETDGDVCAAADQRAGPPQQPCPQQVPLTSPGGAGKQQHQQQHPAPAPEQQEGGADAEDDDAAVRQPSTPQESDHHHVQQQDGSYGDAASSQGGSEALCNKGSSSRAASAEPDPERGPIAISRSPSTLERPAVVMPHEEGTHAAAGLALAAAAAAAAAAGRLPIEAEAPRAVRPQMQPQRAARDPPLHPLLDRGYPSADILPAPGHPTQHYGQQHHHHQGAGGLPPGVVGTFFPVERPRPPPAGDQVNFAQRIMEICFSNASTWPMAISLQFVVDGAPRGEPQEVTVGRSICKSQVSGSRQVIYYVRNPPLLRMARSFDARTVGYRLAGPFTLEWHLSTAPAPPAPAPVAKGHGRRKAGAPGAGRPAGAPRAASASAGSEDWPGAAAPLAEAGADAASAATAAAQHVLVLQQLGALGLGLGAAEAAALQQQLAAAPPELLSQLANWLGAQPQLAAGGGAAGASLVAAAAAAGHGLRRAGDSDGARRIKRRKQQNPSRAPFYGQQSASPGICHVLPCFCLRACRDEDINVASTDREARRKRASSC